MAKAPAKKSNRKSSQRLLLGRPGEVAAPPPRTVPTWWLNTLIGVFMLPIAWIVSKTFFGAFSRATVVHGFWATDEFWFSALGAVLWVLWFFGSIWSLGEPRPLRVYVFGHELTHAVWVWLMGGRVTHFEVSREGGAIYTDTHNVWIALAPYFYPIYSMAILLGYGAVSFFYDVAGQKATFLWMTPLQWMFLGLGITWAFHFSFTCWMIPKGQSDLTTHGTFYSLVLIYVMNVLVLAVFLVVAAPEISWLSFGRELLENTENFAAMVYAGVERLLLRANSF